MADVEKMLSMLREWSDTLREGIALGNGKAMCEASRMVLSVMSLLWAYHPEEFTKERSTEVQTLFEESLARIAADQTQDRNLDEQFDMYERNIGERLETLKKLQTETCHV